MSETKQHHGLRLAMPGAPNTWHHLPGVGVWLHPEHVTPVGEPGELTVQQAREAAKSSDHIEFVDDPHHHKSREVYAGFIREQRGLGRQVLEVSEGDEREIAAAQAAHAAPPAAPTIPGEKE